MPITQETRTITNARQQSIETHLTDEAAIAICRDLRQGRYADTARDIASRFPIPLRHSPSPNQLYFLHLAALEEIRRERQDQLALEDDTTPQDLPTPQITIPLGDYGKVNYLFLHALSYNPRSRRPQPRQTRQLKITLATPAGHVLQLSLATDRSKHAVRDDQGRIIGPIFVTDGAGYPNQQYFGRIDTNGVLHLDRQAETKGWTPDHEDLLRDFAVDPQTIAQEYGHKTGRCCFCNTRLTDEEGDKGTQRGSSVEQGFGLVCARKFGLYHTNLTVVEKQRRRQGQ